MPAREASNGQRLCKDAEKGRPQPSAGPFSSIPLGTGHYASVIRADHAYVAQRDARGLARAVFSVHLGGQHDREHGIRLVTMACRTSLASF